jgi:putative hemolysin
MSLFLELAVIVFFAGVAGLFAGLETGGYLLNRIRLRFLARQREHQAARRLQFVLRDAHRFIFTVLIAQNIAIYLVSRSVTQLYLRTGLGEHSELSPTFLPWNAEVAATLTLMIPLFIFSEILPKNIFRQHADSLMYRFAGLLSFFCGIFQPITALLKWLFSRLAGGRGRTEALCGFSFSLQGLHDYFSEESRRDILSDHQRRMIENLVSMHRVSVQQVMHPVARAAAISEQASIREGIDRMREGDVDQIVVYRGSLRRILGWVSLFDLMDPSLKPSDSVKPLIRKMVRIPAGLTLDKALRRLRIAPEAPALVLTRSSRAEGLLRLSDLTRHIVKTER